MTASGRVHRPRGRGGRVGSGPGAAPCAVGAGPAAERAVVTAPAAGTVPAGRRHDAHFARDAPDGLGVRAIPATLNDRAGNETVAGGHLRRVMPLAHHLVFGVHKHDAGLEVACVRFLDERVGDEDDEVTGVDQPGCGPIDADNPGVSGTFDDVGGQSCAVVDVDDVDFLSGQQIGRLHEIRADGDGADVVQIGMRHCGSVDFRFHDGPEHVS